MEYCHTKKEGEKYALAQGQGLNVSFKDLVEVCRNITGRRAESALAYLEQVFDGETAVRYYGHNKKLGHRHELHGQKGRYPKRAAKAAHSILENAIANAKSLGFSNPKIHHACANKGDIYPRGAPKGRRARSDYETANLQIALRDAQVPLAKPKGASPLEASSPAKVATESKVLAKAQVEKSVALKSTPSPAKAALVESKPHEPVVQKAQSIQVQKPAVSSTHQQASQKPELHAPAVPSAAQKPATHAQAQVQKPAVQASAPSQSQKPIAQSPAPRPPKPPTVHVSDPLGAKKSLVRKEKKEE